MPLLYSEEPARFPLTDRAFPMPTNRYKLPSNSRDTGSETITRTFQIAAILCCLLKGSQQRYLEAGHLVGLVQLVALALTPQGSDVDTEAFRRILERRRFGQHAHYLFPFDLVKAGGRRGSRRG